MIEKHDDGLWSVEHAFKASGIPLTSRMTLAKVNQQEWAIISAVPLSENLVSEINADAKVSYIIAPNNFHHLFINDAIQHWPDAEVFIPHSLTRKRPDLSKATILASSPGAWGNDLQIRKIDGAKMLEEFLFFHAPSKSLIITDLCFNMINPEGFRQTLFTILSGTRGALKTSRMIKLLFKDKAAFKASLNEILEWPFERIVVAHGEIIDTDAKAKLQESFSWVLS